MKGIHRAFLLLVFCAVGQQASSQQTAQKFVQETQYLLYLPSNYEADTSSKWPLVIFLHGSGESGTDLNKVKMHGPPKLVEQGKSFPFILVSPQATNGWQPTVLAAMIRDIKTKLRVDPDRVYLTGLSMGGFGTWELAMKYPEEFAAIAPICGGGDTAKIYRLQYMPVWNFHGAKDNAVPLSASEKMMSALKRYNKDAKFTIYPEAGHDSWTATYTNDSFYTWLLGQKRFKFTETIQPAAQLKKYEGEFLSNENDTLVFFLKGDSLMLNTRKGSNQVMHMKNYKDEIFYFNESSPAQIRFSRNRKGVVDRFIYEGEDLVVFPKLKSRRN
ncbi:prolyl oligopeptidase family serine peptidase [Flavihumibacter sp. UBA7668]|uniref:carboxylesterase family protein n=1 Tax=Flavihumibacter sp. UBA7668 TaxID=1946542 RepID=UPI0025B972FB|nr:PHB depolymerase family esterase [Flavihumibacter sp. UBA7668]